MNRTPLAGIRGSWLLLALACSACSAGQPVGGDDQALAVDSIPREARPADLVVDLPGEAGQVDRSMDFFALDAGPDLADLAADLAVADLAHDMPAPDGPSLLGSYQVARAAIHMHSAYSHDACDGKGMVGGVLNKKCIQQLRAAICAAGLDFVALTDHPSNMSSHSITADLLYDATAGDQLVQHQGAPVANRLSCGKGKYAVLSVGYESKHMMPLGFHSLPKAKALYDGISDSTAMAKVKQQVQALKQLGAVVAMVHSEESDISAKTIVDGGFEVMEWYNIHANFTALLGTDGKLTLDLKNAPALAKMLGKLLAMVDFLDKKTGGPHSDLVYLLFLDTLPKAGFTKWRQAQASRLVTGVLGSDIHQNVALDQNLCAGLMAVVCNGALTLAEAYLKVKIPAVLRNLVLTGGTIQLSDGDRIDSYGRLLRWMENRVLVTKKDQLGFQEALRAGRVYGLYSVFGEPLGFHYSGHKQGTLLQLGQSAKGPVTLQLVLPTRPQSLGGKWAAFTKAEAAQAQLDARLYHTDALGTTLVKSAKTLGTKISHGTSKAGAYHVELWITPKHLTKALGTSSGLASKQFLWLITNPIFVK